MKLLVNSILKFSHKEEIHMLIASKVFSLFFSYDNNLCSSGVGISKINA